ncbi:MULTISPECIES: hypothetical protein [Mycolicibacter]|uniref:Uncharacterized protein n=2 Tax=Mycolicibacter TaxID=1073531 RepID=A0ABU5XME1_9MYCO|nr:MULTISPECIES: hypothetical protein [unclassified Mycolicibacter]MEB3023450.1 hypothetical protein [Mycolicibacter sp. MYC098]MEB3033793.1 hypothetical protein [Mycolicibacter sp. MYC340]
MSKQYPADIIIHDDDWGRIHLGHNLDRDMLRQELLEANVDTPHVGITVEEGHFRYLPRVKWCANYIMGGCDQEGDCHSHWYPVKPQPGSAMTVVTWDKQTPALVDQLT